MAGIRLKIVVSEVKYRIAYPDDPTQRTLLVEEVTAFPVKDDEKVTIDPIFADVKPRGSFTISIFNQDAQNFLKVGQAYYLDISQTTEIAAI